MTTSETAPRPRRRLLPLVAVLITIVLVLGAVAAAIASVSSDDDPDAGETPTPTASPSATAGPASVVAVPAPIDAGSVAGVVAAQSSTADDEDQRAFSTLTLAGDTSLRTATDAIVSAGVAEYEPRRSPGSANELNIGFDAVLAAGPYLGVQATTFLYTGGAHGQSRSQALYTDVTADRTWPSADLVGDPQQLAEWAGVALGQADLSETAPEPAEVTHDVRFGSDGSLVTVMDPGEPVASAAGAVAVRIEPAQAATLLTAQGSAIRAAAMAGQPFAGSTAIPTATARATATATVTSAPTRAPATGDVDCSKLKCIAVTYDDGPGPYTDKLLDELKAAGAHATFFQIGKQTASYPKVAARELAEGHAIGNHTWTHPDLRRLTPDQVNSELDRTAAAIKKATGFEPVLVRPPYGATNDTVQGVLKGRGESAILWDVDTEDWKNRDAAITTQRALAGAHRGAIILMHDIHPSTVKAAPGIYRALQAKGYTLVTIPQLLGDALKPGGKYFSE
ncbi:polysaccharide deacetylase family protein [Cellulomonas sp. PhB150]|uniref:polysaccharide deacetylase family protein n=1 Tax=Cellulomonas sp. PhB150 TaxID=2485188 RepID=UPI0013152587|nr:polysaccharide deacetylase family protein [Cellulomonas sp. PhB150]